MAKRRIFFVRHAKSDFSIPDESTRPLTEAGSVAAINLVETFLDVELDRIFCSPYLRSIETVEPISSAKGISIEIKDDFRERSIGSWFSTVAEFQDFTRKQWLDFNFKLPNGESLSEVQTRNIAILKHILSSEDFEIAIVGTHGTAMCLMLNHYDRRYDLSYFERIADVMPLVVCVDFDGDRMENITEMM